MDETTPGNQERTDLDKKSEDKDSGSSVLPYILIAVIFALIVAFVIYLFRKNTTNIPPPIIANFGVTLIASKSNLAMSAGQYSIWKSDLNCINENVIATSNRPGDVNTGWILNSVSGENPNIIDLQNVFTSRYPSITVGVPNFPKPGEDPIFRCSKKIADNALVLGSERPTELSKFKITRRTQTASVINPDTLNQESVAQTLVTFESVSMSGLFLMIGPPLGINSPVPSIILDKPTSGSDHEFILIS